MCFVNQVGTAMICISSRCGVFTRNLQKVRLHWKANPWMLQPSDQESADRVGNSCSDLFTASVRKNWDGKLFWIRERNERQVFRALDTRLKVEETLLEVDWGSGSKKLQFNFQRTGVLSFCGSYHEYVVLSQNKWEVWNFRSGCKMKLPSSGQIQLFSTSSLVGRDSGWEVSEHSPQITHFPTEPYCYQPLRRDLPIRQ